MKTNKARAIAINGILIALLIVMSITMMFMGGVAVLPLSVIVVGMCVMGGGTALILGLTFGLVSLVTAFISPTITAPLFQNPLVSVLPRLVSVMIAFGIFKLCDLLLSKLDSKLKKPINPYVKKSIGTVLGSIFVVFFNTLLVLSMIWIIFNGKEVGALGIVNKEVVMGFVTINFVIEICVTPIVAAPVVFAVDKFLKKSRKQVVTDADIAIINELNVDIDANKIEQTGILTNDFAKNNDDNMSNNLNVNNDIDNDAKNKLDSLDEGKEV